MNQFQQLSNFQSNITQLCDEIMSNRQENLALHSKINELEIQLASVRTEKSKFELDVKHLKTAFANKDAEVKNLKSALQGKDVEIQRLKEQLSIYANYSQPNHIHVQPTYQPFYHISQVQHMEQACDMFHAEHVPDDYPDPRSPNEMLRFIVNSSTQQPAYTSTSTQSQVVYVTQQASTIHADPSETQNGLYNTTRMTVYNDRNEAFPQNVSTNSAAKNSSIKCPRKASNTRPCQHSKDRTPKSDPNDPIRALWVKPYSQLTPEEKRLRNKWVYENINKPRLQKMSKEARDAYENAHKSAAKRNYDNMSEERKKAFLEKSKIRALDRHAKKYGYATYAEYKKMRLEHKEEKELEKFIEKDERMFETEAKKAEREAKIAAKEAKKKERETGRAAKKHQKRAKHQRGGQTDVKEGSEARPRVRRRRKHTRKASVSSRSSNEPDNDPDNQETLENLERRQSSRPKKLLNDTFAEDSGDDLDLLGLQLDRPPAKAQKSKKPILGSSRQDPTLSEKDNKALNPPRCTNISIGLDPFDIPEGTIRHKKPTSAKKSLKIKIKIKLKDVLPATKSPDGADKIKEKTFQHEHSEVEEPIEPVRFEPKLIEIDRFVSIIE